MECKAFETKRAAQVDFARLRRCLDLAACRDEIMTEIYHSRMTNPKPPKTFQNRRVNSPFAVASVAFHMVNVFVMFKLCIMTRRVSAD